MKMELSTMFLNGITQKGIIQKDYKILLNVLFAVAGCSIIGVIVLMYIHSLLPNNK